MTSAVPRITPYLYYWNIERSLAWLTQAFGMRAAGPDGKPSHAELIVGTDGALMIGCPGPEYRTPKDLGHLNQSLYVRVDDVDALFARAMSAGAKVIEKPADQEYGDRRCAVEDCEGHHWFFAQPVSKGK